ncbi:hypothetical protein [Polyangium fumosum]|uniref:DUF4276 family protein n=1 Tax=Polyangium fumosum TaxID=889272 RepID=A0A4U1JBG8_9BACT|nr:hypothetical protein [Polyangium fumosum]TKD07344.1 hypothetical protein E8A74_18005 [Polyangium fumosum]
MTLGLLVVCEAPEDFAVATCIIDRTLRETETDWLRDLFEHSLDEQRSWVPLEPDRPFLDWHHLDVTAKRLDVRPQRGHFGGRPGAPDALATRKALAILQALRKQGRPISVAVLMRDIDKQPERADGIKQACEEAAAWDPDLCVVLGLPDPELEAWLLAGFDPADTAEETRLAHCKRDLGLDPRTSAHALRATHDQDRRSVKYVLAQLTGDDHERRAKCYEAAPLSTLMKRGRSSGLTTFLDEIRSKLLPLFLRSPPPPASTACTP